MSEATEPAPGPTTVVVDVAAAGRPIRRSWELAVGCGDAWSILRADLQAQLRRAIRECGFRYLRCHGILCDQLQAVRRDRAGDLVYNWQLVDTVYDTLLEIGLRPFVELGFMPSALASGDQTVFFYRANLTPPADDTAWSGFIRALVEHWRERYGAEELRRWYFEVWNEANLSAFWSSTREEYFRLYAETARALKAIDPALRVGGPATSRGEWLPEFMAWCRERDVQVDVVSTHVYPDDDEFEQVDPEYRTIFERGDYLEALVGRAAESMAAERLVGGAGAAGAGRLEQHWTEWNASWRWGRPIHDETNQAAFICRAIHAVHDQVDSFAFWTISDIFNEFPYPRSALVGGFGLLTIDGLPKPGYHAYRLLHRLGDAELPTAAEGGSGDDPRFGRLDCWATRSNDGCQVLLANYVPPGLADPAAPLDPSTLPSRDVVVRIRGLVPGEEDDGRFRLVEYRVDADHANILGAWNRLGRPDTPTLHQLAELRAAAELEPTLAREVQVGAGGELTLRTTSPPASVVLLALAWS
jgi:xylan 1,4-beta-xylosidase